MCILDLNKTVKVVTDLSYHLLGSKDVILLNEVDNLPTMSVNFTIWYVLNIDDFLGGRSKDAAGTTKYYRQRDQIHFYWLRESYLYGMTLWGMYAMNTHMELLGKWWMG